ncbi:hypothetical protein [Staphylococcus aureus]|nr:hypothetical protein [Staphylococcus aureus]
MIMKMEKNIERRKVVLIEVKGKYLKKVKMIMNWKMSKLMNEVGLEFEK